MHKQQDNSPPIVMCFSGHDPGGGAGIQADIESVNANHARACTVITALTVQDSHDVQQLVAVDKKLFHAAAATLLNDLAVNAFKTGLLADAAIVDTIAQIIQQHATVPLIIDPVLASGAGTALSGNALIHKLRSELLPRATITTPNLPEAQALGGEQNPDSCAEKILGLGCQHVLLTGTHANTEQVINTLYSKNGKTEFPVERLAGSFHGSGCTLASSLAANLANKHDLKTAVSMALEYTWQSLRHAEAIGQGQRFPNRHFSND